MRVHEAADWAIDQVPKPVLNGLALTAAGGVLVGGTFMTVGAIAEGDPFGTLKRIPYVVGETFNICDSSTEDQKSTIEAAIQYGRDNPYETHPLLKISPDNRDELMEVTRTPNLDHAKSLLNEVTTKEFGFETKYGDKDENPDTLKEDVNQLAEMLLRTHPTLFKGALLETVELNSTEPGEDENGSYLATNGGKIMLKPGTVKKTLPHELGHGISTALNAKRCVFPSTDDYEMEKANPLDFEYGEENEKLPASIIREVTFTDYSATGGPSEEAAEIIEIIQNVDPKDHQDRICVLGKSAVTDAKLKTALVYIEQVASGLGQAYAQRIGADSVAPYCKK